MFRLNKILRNYCERAWLLPVKFNCFSGKNLKCLVTDCKRGHQSKTAVFQLSCELLNFYSFSYKMRPWISKFCPQKSKNRILPPPSPSPNRSQLSMWDYLNYDQKVTTVSGENPETLEFGRIKFRLKFCPKFFHTKTFCEYCKSSKLRPRSNHWNFREFLLEVALERRGVKVACVVKMKLFFMDWFYYKLIILIK